MTNIIKPEELTLPAFGPTAKTTDMTKYRAKYFKADLDDPADLLELELLTTRGIRGDGIVILDKDKYAFKDSYYIILTYLELINE